MLPGRCLERPYQEQLLTISFCSRQGLCRSLQGRPCVQLIEALIIKAYSDLQRSVPVKPVIPLLQIAMPYHFDSHLRNDRVLQKPIYRHGLLASAVGALIARYVRDFNFAAFTAPSLDGVYHALLGNHVELHGSAGTKYPCSGVAARARLE